MQEEVLEMSSVKICLEDMVSGNGRKKIADYIADLVHAETAIQGKAFEEKLGGSVEKQFAIPLMKLAGLNQDEDAFKKMINEAVSEFKAIKKPLHYYAVWNHDAPEKREIRFELVNLGKIPGIDNLQEAV